jgi:hypothetical protein
MAQRIYWVPHTVCFFGCEHCHNDSLMEGIHADHDVIDKVVANLPEPNSRYPLQDVLVGGGESLMRNQGMEYLIKRFRERFPQGPQGSLEEKRAGGHVILALQTMGFPLADSKGRPVPRNINYWLDQGVDYFHIASNDIFHERRRPDYPWEEFRQNLRDYGQETGIYFHIYGKSEEKLVPSGRVLDTLPELEKAGARLLLSEGYCAEAWEAANSFLSGINSDYPHCSEVVIDPHGWVHPCCWHDLSPGLFRLTEMSFEEGMDRAHHVSFCHALDEGDMIKYTQEAGIELSTAQTVRNKVGDCGACRLASVRLARHPEYNWLNAPELSSREVTFYEKFLGEELLEEFLPRAGVAAQKQQGRAPIHLI